MAEKFNKIRYIELLKKNLNLESKNSSLYKENKLEYWKLLSYGEILQNQVFYNRRHDSISLTEKYITNEIDFLLLRLQFFSIQRGDRKIKKGLAKYFKRLSTISIDFKSVKFSLLINDIFDACKALKSDSEPEKPSYK
jgi:hypothetical protein